MNKKWVGVLLSLLVVCGMAFQGMHAFVYAQDVNTASAENSVQETASQAQKAKAEANGEKAQKEQHAVTTHDEEKAENKEKTIANTIKPAFAGLANRTRGAPIAKVPARSAKELTKVISNIQLWDTSEGKYVTKTNDTYQLVKGRNYRFETDFDLSAYNGDLENGDTFTLTVPEPFTVKDGTIVLTHKETGIEIGVATVTSNGEGKGGTVKVTLQNLDKYLEKTGADEVRDLKGTFYVNFTVSEITTEKTVTYNTTETTNVITHKITVKEKTTTDYTEAIGKANYSKFGGVLEKRPYTSEKLGKSGTYVHPWYVRVNVRQASYDTIKVMDSISKDYAPMQYIPETAKVIYGYYDSTYSFHKDGELTEGADYTVEYNSSYTEFELKISNASSRTASNGKPASYQLAYCTTAPADGSSVANTVEVYGDETQLTVSTDSTKTSTTVVRNSKITEGGTITLDVGYRIVLYKVDATTGNMLAGAVFKVTTPSGEEMTLPATDAGGRTYSRTFTSQEAAAGDFIITEVTAPDGFKLLNEPIKVKVGSEGAIKTISNEPKEISVKVSKKWIGKEGGAVTVHLYADGEDTGRTLTLDEENDWQASFEGLRQYRTSGEAISYTVKEDVPAGYEAKVTGSQEEGFTITNTNTGKVSVPVTKQWVGKAADQVKVKLLADGVEKDTATLTADSRWKHTFEDLPKYDAADGHEIVYTVAEENVDGYTTGISGTVEEGFTITNTIAGKVSVPVTKKWVGSASDSITVNLYADGEKIDTRKLSKDNHWQYTFKDLAQYKDGKEIAYTIQEEKVPGYTAAIKGDAEKGFVITNTKNTTDTPDTPKNTPTTPANLPKTGDSRHFLIYGGIAAAALALMLFLIGRKRKQL